MTTFQSPKGMSRRKFMAFAGGAAGLAAMAAVGISAERGECSANIPEIDIDKMTVTENEADVLVVGSGIAGLFAAVKGHDAGAKILHGIQGASRFIRANPFCQRNICL